MCGIVAVARRRSQRSRPDVVAVEAQIDSAARRLGRVVGTGVFDAETLAEIDDVATWFRDVDRALRGAPGVSALLEEPIIAKRITARTNSVHESIAELDLLAERVLRTQVGAEVEKVNRALVALKDAVWAVAEDRLRTACETGELAGGASGEAAIEAYLSIQVALAALDRLEVRGRDSAGLLVVVSGHALDLADPTIAELSGPRVSDALFGSLAMRKMGASLAFGYKTAAEVGRLGDNTTVLRQQIRGDELLRLALSSDSSQAVVLGHTRWASVGIISEPNTHPLDSTELHGAHGPFVSAALNGDVDNYADLRADEGLSIAPEITTDAKVIPTMVSRRLATGADPIDAFQSTVSRFEGSVAVAAQTERDPSSVLLAQRGSGQALYVGLGEDLFLVASEPYGLVEEADEYLRLDGETPVHAGNPASSGQIVALDTRLAGTLGGITRLAYDGTPLPVQRKELLTPEITTRDVDRGDHDHFLLKEITQSPASFRRTLRGRLVEREGSLKVELSEDALPTELRDRLRTGGIRRVIVVGQGTAAVAGRSLAVALRRELGGEVPVEAMAATELSGFAVRDDMSDTLCVAISQSGTTTDTNRTVDVVRARGGAVVSIVNRRESDLVDRSDGVLYTSDGRDVEMSVASTKAFYAQVAAGLLLAVAIADEVNEPGERADRQQMLAALGELPIAMRAVLERRDRLGEIAQRVAPSRRSWAVVGNGTNHIAAEEVRIKLSELCYKSIACDVTEDKKHIDLSAEPLVIVCAAGLVGSNVDDVAKEVSIFQAHKAAPVVFATEGDTRFAGARDVVGLPATHPDFAFVLCAMAGHLFGYEAAIALDASANPLREARGAIESVLAGQPVHDELMEPLAAAIAPAALRFQHGMASGIYDGSLDASTAVRLAALIRYATGLVPLDNYQLDFGKVGTPDTLVADLAVALSDAIDELARPIDAIRHQAKTVTVGISRSDETLLRVRLVQEVLATGAGRDNLGYRTLRHLVALDEAVDEVVGFTRYRIDENESGKTVSVVDKGGIAVGIPSRTEDDPRLRGTKHRAATEREVNVVRGRADKRTIVIVPEVKGTQTIGLALLHVRFHDRLAPEAAKRVLSGYRDRYDAIRDAVTETEPTLRDDLLGEIPIVDLLSEPVFVLAEHWRTTN